MGRSASLIFGALSLTFPEGERMFIRSVRNYRDRVESRELKQQVAGFIGQSRPPAASDAPCSPPPGCCFCPAAGCAP